jgi:hypothetical protein
MPYPAKVFNVMIASPSDVQEERRIIHEAIIAWNYINSQSEGIVLLPLTWETHSAPLLGDRPQGIINNQVLRHADLLVGIFGSRIGTSTGRAISGSVEEIEEHTAKLKPAMVYFSAHRASAGNLDANQLEEVNKFEEKCRKIGITGSYTSPVDLKAQFPHHLQIIVKDKIKEPAELPTRIIEDTTGIIAERIPRLSHEAKRLLLETSRDPKNTVFKAKFTEGIFIRTNDLEFKDGDWPGALDQLYRYNCVRAKVEDSEFLITDFGHQTLAILSRNPQGQ